MLTIQQVGQEILSKKPNSFYVFVGEEYGIKDKYIQIMTETYGNKIEVAKVSDVLSMMHTKRLIPLQPTLYVIRYDEEFLSSLSAHTSEYIAKTNIVGTIVCIYEQPKQVAKVEKYLSDYTVSIDAVNPQFITNYLSQDFPHLKDKYIQIAVKASTNYSQARNICRSMSSAPDESLSNLSDDEIATIFGYVPNSTEEMIRIGVAARNFRYLLPIVESYEGDGDRIIYAILQTMIELDKIISNSKVNSDLRPYIKSWKREDIYYMFMNSYSELNKLRSTSSYDVKNSIIYLIGLLTFEDIPSPEAMQS